MARRMSVSMTIDAVRDRSKTVTRRHINTWETLKPGDQLTLVEKGMGLKKGEKQIVLAEVEVVDVRVEPLGRVSFLEIDLEGLWPAAHQATTATGVHPARWFMRFWADGHGYTGVPDKDLDGIECRRIEWRYLNEKETES